MGGKIAMQAALSYAHKVEKIVIGDIYLSTISPISKSTLLMV
jgi:hypothetical protein